MQAVPYSREFKQKYDYFRKKLKKPVRSDFSKYIYPFLGLCVWGHFLFTKMNLVQTSQLLF